MKPNTNHFHGSDLEKIETVYHINKNNITTFSSNVNPLGPSDTLYNILKEHVDIIASYPDRDYTALRESIASYIDSTPEHILVGNGTTELISLFIQITHPVKALLLSPTYSEYERELILGESSYSYYELNESNDFQLNPEHLLYSLDPSLDLLIICNPNNPTSTSIDRQAMEKIVKACSSLGITVMIDETYVEFVTEPSAITAIPLTEQYTNLIVLRGTSKFFAVPGLRLGYAITGSQTLIEQINHQKNPWGINSLADLGGRYMFHDSAYIEESRTLIASERQRICDSLSRLDSLKVYPPTANFILIKILKEDITSSDFFQYCIKKGLMVRDCSSFESLQGQYIRFCILSKKQNNALLSCFHEIFH